MKKNEILRLGIILFIITAVAGLILGAAYQITKDPIDEQITKKNNEAMEDTLPEAKNFKKLDIKINNDTVKEVNEGSTDSQVVGYAIKVAPKGYGGDVEIMVGIGVYGKIEGIKILSQNETPGLGANSTKKSFYGQYKNKSIDSELTVVKTSPSNPNEIQALTGATITSKAVTSGVNEAVKFYQTQLKGGKK